MKTNAARSLDNLGIAYELRSYEVDPTDLSAESVYDRISVSAGMRGLQILLHPSDYIRAVKGVVGMISQDKD